MHWFAGLCSILVATFAWSFLRQFLGFFLRLLVNPRGPSWPFCAFLANAVAAFFSAHIAMWTSNRYLAPTSVFWMIGASLLVFVVQNLQLSGVADAAMGLHEWTIDENYSPMYNAGLRRERVIRINGSQIVGALWGYFLYVGASISLGLN